MKLTIEHEAGYEQALRGLALSYYKQDTPFEEYFKEVRPKMIKLLTLLNSKSIKEGNYSHSKVLRQIHVWVMITSTRSFWSQFATYTVGVVSQSASTMHTLSKTELSYQDFSLSTSASIVNAFLDLKDGCKDIILLRDNLPEGFLQTRMVTFNYASLQNIIMQRSKHRYAIEWHDFEYQLKRQLKYPEIIKWSESND
jgi:hypothetical protein